MNAPHLNGSINGDSSAVTSPVLQSPASPPSTTLKIDVDYQEESDVRHEPLPVKLDKLDNHRKLTCFFFGLFFLIILHAFVSSATIPIHILPTPVVDEEGMSADPAPNGDVHSELVEDVQMEEPKVETNGHTNGTVDLDHPMDVQTPAPTLVASSLPAASSSTTIESNPVSTPYSTPNDCSRNDDDKPPPAKRARMNSDADKASLAHVSAPRLVRRYGRANHVLSFRSLQLRLQPHHHLLILIPRPSMVQVPYHPPPRLRLVPLNSAIVNPPFVV